jgi:hypothetical protein
MADEKEPKAITYKQVISAVGKDGAREAWDRVGQITGAGQVGTGINDDASIDITSISDAKQEQIDKLLTPEKPAKSTKEGGK